MCGCLETVYFGQANFKFKCVSFVLYAHTEVAKITALYIGTYKYIAQVQFIVSFIAIAPSPLPVLYYTPIPVVKTPMRLLSQKNQLH